ncbi:MAG: CHRD domain-containing protein [Chitinophagaceae bacterium]
MRQTLNLITSHFSKVNGRSKNAPIARLTLFTLLLLAGFSFNSLGQMYSVVLNGGNESPANPSAGTGTAIITVNAANSTMRVQCSFSGLTGNTTASHIHAATTVAGSGTAGVATTTPTFAGFPLGVTSGSYDNTLDMTQASSFNPSYVTAHGNNVAQAWSDLRAAIAEGKSYLNIHSTVYGGGEIRGFMVPFLNYSVILNGLNESPANASPGTGMGTVSISPELSLMRVQCVFSGLQGTTTASHLHAATAVAGTGTAGVATTTPSFAGFPLGVTSGSFDQTYDMTMASSYNPSYVSAHGGTTAQAFTDLRTAIADGKSYLNIHTSVFGGGEIRGFTTTPAPCGAVTDRLYVDGSVASSGTGAGWGCALKELSTAVTMANANPSIKSIWVAAGIYKPTTGTSRTAVIATTRADLQILGGFAGGETDPATANPAVNLTIISGDIGIANDMSDNSYRLFNIGGNPVTESPLLIDGFIFEKGNANAPGDGDQSVGAALLSYGIPAATPVRIKRCTFRNNFGQATGAIFLVNTNIDFDGCRFAANTSNGSGGGVLAYQCNQTFNNCVFAANSVTNGGGAFYGNYGTATFSKTTFTGNSAGTGGAIYLNRYNSNVSNSLFNANTSVSGGGGMFIHNGSLSTVTNTTFFKNTAASSGGAIVLVEAGSSITAGNNIFYKNTASGQPTGAGSDITNFTNGSNTWANNILQMGTSVPADNGGNLRNNTRGTDPLFVNEANAIGADNIWATADDGLALTLPSPAKNSGENTLVSGATDITGNARIACVTVDKGAYENQNCCTTNLLGTDVTGSLSFGGGTNYFNSSNGFVPAGCGNSGTGSTTVTIADPDAEFCFSDGANADNANFTNNTLTITDMALSAAGASNFSMTFQLAPGQVGGVSKTSDNFPNGGMTSSLSGGLLTVTMPGFSGVGNYSASYSFTNCAPSVADPVIASVAANGVSGEGNTASGVSASTHPSIVTISKDVLPAGTGIVNNPFSNDLQVRYTGNEKAVITVIGSNGKAMWNRNNVSEGITHIDAGSWSRGIYQVTISTASGKRINYKVVKM